MDPLAGLVSIGIPLGFLVLVRRLDLYAASPRPVLICAAVGLAAFPLALFVNTLALNALRTGMAAAAAVALVRLAIAPVVEEALKATGVVVVSHRRDFTFFADGAVCGFAAGTAFAVVENLFYVQRLAEEAGLGLSLNRALSTSLMHGTASALVGVAVARLRFGGGRSRLTALLAGLSLAMLYHVLFNRLVNSGLSPALMLAGAIGLGLSGVAAVAGVVWLGLREERRWLADSLSAAAGVAAGEAGVVLRLQDLPRLLAPLEAHFGAEKRRQVEAFLRLQARYGLRRKLHDLAHDPAERAGLAADVASLRQELDRRRREVGVYCMAYVRSILPSPAEPIWDILNRALAEERPATSDLWSALGQRLAPADEGPALSAADANGA
jgi:RsiW-degrading membrane proteinase PrsW (M82 family)